MHIYFSGIGGVGIGPLALLALDAGYTVSGSDQAESDMTRLVADRGAAVHIGQEVDTISKIHSTTPIDWFVYSAALKDDHTELKFAGNQGIRLSKRADFLNTLLKDLNLKLVAVSGTHGKTTTTGMLVWLLKQLSKPVSYSVGTTLSFGPPAQYVKGSTYFIYECDEFDRNFLEFQPELSIITSLDYDHPDTYPTERDYTEAFKTFCQQSEITITWEDIVDRLSSDAHFFALAEDQLFDHIKLAGLHNRRNAWLACTAINRLGIVANDLKDWEKVLKIVSDFPGTSRRFEKLAENIYSDYAHHPTEIAATIAAARELNKNVVVIYQPHQNIRQHELQQENAYAHCFDGISKLYWLPTYLSREDKDLPVLSAEELSSRVTTVSTEIAEMNSDLSAKIMDHQEAGDLVVGMSAGDLDGWLRKLSSK